MDYSRYQKIAKDQIAKYGQLVTFHFSVSGGKYDPVAGKHVANTVEDQETSAVLASPKESAFMGGTIHVGDAVLLIDGGSLARVPSELDTVTVAGAEWRVVAVTRVAPSEIVIIYKVFIRRS